MDFFLQDKFSFDGVLQPRERGGITLIGPDFFEEDSAGKLLSHIASAFPGFRTIITVRGIHSTHAEIMIAYLKEKLAENGTTQSERELEEAVYADAVPLILRNSRVLIRSNPEHVDRIFAADAMIQVFLPKDLIQFTGPDIDELRKMLRDRGESWRMSPHPRSVDEICEYVRSSRLQVSTGLTVYYNAPTGGRFLTFEEFMHIRPLMRSDGVEALARLREIVTLCKRVNSFGSRELSFFLPADKTVNSSEIDGAVLLLESSGAGASVEKAEALFDSFADQFSRQAGAELTIDDEHNAVWRNTMFCRLYDINEHEMETWALGLSPEFHLNVQWLPGAVVSDGKLCFDQGASHRARGMISYYWKNTGGFASVNLGRVERPQTLRDVSGEERDVYVVVMTMADCRASIRLVRHMKWDAMHRVKLGVPIERAINDTVLYRDYIFDRIHAATQLGFPILTYGEIELEEVIPGMGNVPAYFFERQYIPGIVTDKIPLAYYRKPDFIVGLARQLGIAASFTLVLGKANPRTGNIYFDDGDELIQLNESAIPDRLVLIETTGSFTNWTTPLLSLLPQCLRRFRTHLDKAAAAGVSHAVLKDAVAEFAEALNQKILSVKEAAFSDSVRDLFKSRPPEHGGIRHRWEGIIARLDRTSALELKERVLSGPELEIRKK